MESTNLLAVKGISLDFGGHRALSDVTCHVSDGEILGLIGPNGAGKTCVLNCVTMFYKPHLGQVFFQGKDITGYRTHQIADLGIARTFQNIELFSGLTVLENLMVGRHIRMKAGATACSLYFGRARAEEIRHREVVEEIIDLLEMEAIRNKKVGSLPYGQRKRVDLGRALAMEPKLLLLDEPLAGMNVEEKEDMVRFVMDVHELKKTSIILVEHDMGVVMDLVHRLVVLDFGVKIADGPPERIKQDEGVIKAYLGSSAAEHGTKTL
jgi:branched-chain amino acid transport system ATP-binding protein